MNPSQWIMWNVWKIANHANINFRNCSHIISSIYIYIYIYKTETFEAFTIFHISTILKKKTHRPKKKKNFSKSQKILKRKIRWALNRSHALPSPFLQNANNTLPFPTCKSQLSNSIAPPSLTPPFSSFIFVGPTVWLSLQSSSILIQNLLLSNLSPLPNADL